MENLTSFRTHNSKIWICSLLTYFMNIKTIDDSIERLRISLCSQPNFSPLKLFHFLDKISKEFLLLNDFIKFLKEMQIPFDENVLRIFIHNFDKDGDFCLNLKEFLGLILPKKNSDLAKKVRFNLNNINDNEDIISINVKNIFGKILCEELELVKNCIKTSKICKEKIGFTLYEAFLAIAGNDKYITEEHLYKFLIKNNINIDTKDMHQLMFRLDADNDGKISFDEFKEIFFPIKDRVNIYEIKQENNNIDSNFNNKFENKNEIKYDNVIDFTFGEISGTKHKINKEATRNNKPEFDVLNEKKYNLSMNTNKENIQNNYNSQKESIYSRTRKIFQLKNPSYTQKVAPKIIIPKKYQESYQEPMVNNIPQKKYKYNYSNNPLLKNKNIKIDNSPYRPAKLRKINTAYMSPKIRHTKSPLHYDYSTYSDEDGDEYFKNKRLKQNKVSLTDKRARLMNEDKVNKVMGLDYKKIIRNNLEKMFNEDNVEDKDEKDINKENKKPQIKPKFNFIYNGNDENDIVIRNFDDIKLKNK